MYHCQICGGYRERTGKLIDISKHTGKKICMVAEYECVDCHKKSLMGGTDVEHFKS